MPRKTRSAVTTETITTETITTEQIKALRTEAGAAGDNRMVDLCTAALAGYDHGLQACVDAINAARAQDVVASYAPEVYVQGEWSGNALRFATEAEAARWGRALLLRWFVPTDSRVVPSSDPVNYRLTDDGALAPVA